MPIKPSTQVLLAVLLTVVALPLYLQAAPDALSKTRMSDATASVTLGGARPKSPKALLSCLISTPKTAYKIGEVVKVQVRVKNEGDKAIYLVGSLDGSEDRMRYPYCSFEISDSKGKVLKPSSLRCGNTNPLRPANFIKVEPKSTFNPYMRIDDSGFFDSYQLSPDAKTFSKPGLYKLRFSYSTESSQMERWLGDGRLGQDHKRDVKLSELFQQVPKLSVKSNELVIRFVE